MTHDHADGTLTRLSARPRAAGDPLRVAVVGAGISGLGCAHILDHDHEVTVYEAGFRAGGHADTAEVRDGDRPIPIDMGFIVYNEHTYPHFTRLLDGLGVATQPSDMSFGAGIEATGLEYRLTNPATIFAQPSNFGRPPYLRMLYDITRFNRAARNLASGGARGPAGSLGEFVDALGLSREFREWFLVPLGSAVWSADPDTFLEFPATTYARFMQHHGLLQLRGAPRWRTIAGGSRSYVRALAAPLGERLRLAEPVTGIRRRGGIVEVVSRSGVATYDRVVVATHSDQALALLEDPTAVEREVLGAITYRRNSATLHSDTRVMPRARRAWASWNVSVPAVSEGAPTLSYWMNNLQALPTATDWFVSLNSDERIDPSKIAAQRSYEHPVFNLASRAAQRRFDELQGAGGIYYAGAWWGEGFHEDGLRSAHEVCERLLAERTAARAA